MQYIFAVALTIAGLIEVGYSQAPLRSLVKVALVFITVYTFFSLATSEYLSQRVTLLYVFFRMEVAGAIIGFGLVVLTAMLKSDADPSPNNYYLKKSHLVRGLLLLTGLGIFFSIMMEPYGLTSVVRSFSDDRLFYLINIMALQNRLLIPLALTLVGLVEIAWSKTLFRGLFKATLLFIFTFCAFASFAFRLWGPEFALRRGEFGSWSEVGLTYAIGWGFVLLTALMISSQRRMRRMTPEQRQTATVASFAILGGVIAVIGALNEQSRKRTAQNAQSYAADRALAERQRADQLTAYNQSSTQAAAPQHSQDEETESEVEEKSSNPWADQQAAMEREREEDQRRRDQRWSDQQSFYADKERRGD